ncbi:MAG: guanylate kinase [Nanoarchaeota archaeon]|nr:guanylate kinase [Nanoarchaeota archaeon]
MEKFKPFVISGASGAGKTTLVDRMISKFPELERVITTTTRDPRLRDNGEMERNGIDYHFFDRAQFVQDVGAGRFLEWAEIYGNMYGNHVSEIRRIRGINKSALFIVDIQGLIALKRNLDSCATIFIYPPNIAILEERLLQRGEKMEAIPIRMREAYSEIVTGREHSQYHLINSDLSTAEREMAEIIAGELEGIGASKYLHPPSLELYARPIK